MKMLSDAIDRQCDLVDNDIEVFRAPATLNSVEDSVSLLLARIEAKPDGKRTDPYVKHIRPSMSDVLTRCAQLPILPHRTNRVTTSRTHTEPGTIPSSPNGQINRTLNLKLCSLPRHQAHSNRLKVLKQARQITKAMFSISLTLSKRPSSKVLGLAHWRISFGAYLRHPPPIPTRSSQLHC